MYRKVMYVRFNIIQPAQIKENIFLGNKYFRHHFKPSIYFITLILYNYREYK